MQSANLAAAELEELLDDPVAALAEVVDVVDPSEATPGEPDELPPHAEASIAIPSKTGITIRLVGFACPDGLLGRFLKSSIFTTTSSAMICMG